MSTETKSLPTKLCPTCGTRLSEDATRCLVCGADLGRAEKPAQAARGVQASRMPEVTLSLPVVILLLALFLAIGAVMVFFAVKEKPEVIIPLTPTATLTITLTPSLTPTLAPPTVTDTPQPTPTPIVYTVRAGETCGIIAANFQVSIESIRQSNNLSIECFLSEGQQLFIPQPTPTVTPLPSATFLPAEQTLAACEKIEYTVQDNDTLGTISANYNVPMEAIREYNGLVGDVVPLGQVIIIPLCEQSATPGPTPTATLPPPYAAPSLLLPLDGAPFSLADDSVTLQWASVGVLRESERYQVIIEDVTEGLGRRLNDTVTDTKFIVPVTFRHTDGLVHTYRWWVTTVRQNGVDADGKTIWESAGAVSAPRVFTWSGVGGATPTPGE